MSAPEFLPEKKNLVVNYCHIIKFTGQVDVYSYYTEGSKWPTN